MLESLNKNYLVRRMAIAWMLIMTTYIMKWAVVFAMNSPRSGTDVAMILAAVLTPWSTFAGFIFKFYTEARNSAVKE